MPISLNVNGEVRVTERDNLAPLVDVLRDDFALLGAKAVCREGFCGACTVLVDGEAVMSCLLPAGLAEGRAVTTVEGLAQGGRLAPVQQALLDHDAVQCGMCFPGMVMTLTRFLATNPSPSRDEVRAALTGNVCRCTGYERILDAALAVSRAA